MRTFIWTTKKKKLKQQQQQHRSPQSRQEERKAHVERQATKMNNAIQHRTNQHRIKWTLKKNNRENSRYKERNEVAAALCPVVIITKTHIQCKLIGNEREIFSTESSSFLSIAELLLHVCVCLWKCDHPHRRRRWPCTSSANVQWPKVAFWLWLSDTGVAISHNVVRFHAKYQTAKWRQCHVKVK